MFRLFSFANTVDFCQIVIIINRYAKVRKVGKVGRKVFGLSPGDSLLVLGDEENGIVLARAEVLNHVAMEILGKVNSPQKDERE